MGKTAMRLGVVAIVPVSGTFFVTSAPLAQGTTEADLDQGVDPALDIAQLFVWITPQGINWSLGVLLAIAGVVGALVTTYILIGGAIPGTAGTARLDEDAEQLDRLSRLLEVLIDPHQPPSDTMLLHEVASTVDSLQRYLIKERWRQFIVAAFLYAVLGGAVASALAQNLLQAFLIGAGWTSFVGSFGLTTEYTQRKARKDEALYAVLNELRNEVQAKRSTLGAVSSEIGAQSQPPPHKLQEQAQLQQRVDKLENVLRHAESAQGL